MAINTDSLFSDFQHTDFETWKQQLLKDLKGKPYESIVWNSPEGITVDPAYFHTTENSSESNSNEFPFRRGTSKATDWNIAQDYRFYSSESDYNKQAIDALINGANYLRLLPESNTDLLEQLKDIHLNMIGLELDINLTNYHDILVSLEQLLSKYNKSECSGSFSLDPFDHVFYEAYYPKALQAYFTNTATIKESFYRFAINGAKYHNAGATVIQQVAYMLAEAVELIETLKDGEQIADVIGSIQFNVANGSNYFFEIAKLRALRILWSNVQTAYGLPEISVLPAQISGETSLFELAGTDTNTNILRATTQTMSLVLGGANTISVFPHNLRLDEANLEFSQRIARNIQLILKEESYLNKVTDAAAGSYYIEDLTNKIANQAWTLFSDITDNGGFVQWLEAGKIQAAINESKQQKIDALNTQKQTLIGVNKYFNQLEKPQKIADFHSLQPTRIEPIQPIFVSDFITVNS